MDFRNRPFRSAWNFYFQNRQNGVTWLKNLSCEDEFHFHENKKTIFESIASHVPSLRNRDSGQRENGLLKIYGKVKRTFFFHQPRDILQSLALWFPGGSKGQITPSFWRRTSKKKTHPHNCQPLQITFWTSKFNTLFGESSLESTTEASQKIVLTNSLKRLLKWKIFIHFGFKTS